MNLRQTIDRLFPDKSSSNLHTDHSSFLLVIAFCVSRGVIRVEIAWDEFYASIFLQFDKMECQQLNDIYGICICHIIEYRERVIIY